MRSLTGTGLIVTALTATLAALLFPLWSYADRTGTAAGAAAADPTAGSVPTRFGPLSAADRDFVERVRLAGLWETPAGQQALERGTTAAVKLAGRHLVDGHTALDQHVRDVGQRLGLELPSQPTAEQRRWLTRLDAAHGGAYDREFANILRFAHGKVFALVGQVRAGTRNSAVRELADDAATTVLDHMKVLEETGLVDFDALASGPPPPAPPGRGAGPPPAPAVTPALPPAASHAHDAPEPASPGPDPAATTPPVPSLSPSSPSPSEES
ncbi:DUF4142 domain-containing protein [Streptomyces griseocarneus]|uniref:DUF4142 domain-containing protein n=2 Tax=Streptomyces griseocarneus TaxID=51201 RepID=UPI00167DA706|nr:DUF4142 domain-containing protein [Streptomyces griseocarneus]GHG46139.1 hypothetical protein GCM10018779_02500 [Streptomyces griseocarneus]